MWSTTKFKVCDFEDERCKNDVGVKFESWTSTARGLTEMSVYNMNIVEKKVNK